MAIKKSELYSSIWASCDELRGGMDASQYKDYVLTLLFVKYVSDKYENDSDGLIEVPEGGSFKDMVALKHNKEIGDKMNTIIGELAKANDLVGVIDVADFNDDEKLGKGQEMIDRLTKLLAIFVKPAIFNHPEFTAFSKEMDDVFETWKTKNTQILKALEKGFKPKQLIHRISEDILATYTGHALMDKYDVYQHLMDYWNNVMQDDCYFLAAEGWKAELTITKQTKTVTEWDCDLVPKTLVIDRYFLTEKKAIEQLEAEKESVLSQIAELEEEHNTEEGFFAELDKVNKANVQKRLKAIDIPKLKTENAEEIKVLKAYLKLTDDLSDFNKKIKEALADLEKKVIARYKTLTVDEIKQLVVDDKWMTALERDVKTEMERISQRLTQRIKELAERYETPLPKQTEDVKLLKEKVNTHLAKMGFKWQNV